MIVRNVLLNSFITAPVFVVSKVWICARSRPVTLVMSEVFDDDAFGDLQGGCGLLAEEPGFGLRQ